MNLAEDLVIPHLLTYMKNNQTKQYLIEPSILNKQKNIQQSLVYEIVKNVYVRNSLVYETEKISNCNLNKCRL